jgi:WD40 repeat protein
LSPDASTIAFGDGKTVKLWNVNAKEQRLLTPGHNSTIRSIDFAPDGRTLASCADDHTVRVWDVEQRTEQRQWATGASNHAWHLKFSKDGKAVITANWQHAEVRDPSTGRLITSLAAAGSSALTEARMLPDQKTVVGVDFTRIHVWNVEEKHVVRTFSPPLQKSIHRSTISPDGQFAALAGDTGIDILDTSTGKAHSIPDEGGRSGPETLAFSLDGRYLAWPSRSAVVVWDMKRMEIDRRIKTRAQVRALAFDRSGRYLAAAGDDPGIRIWEVKNGNPAGEFTRAGGPIYCLAFSATEDILASAGDDCIVTLWDLHKKTVPPPVASTDDMLQKLLAAYRLYGLPTPPAHARLVSFSRSRSGKAQHHLGLLVQPPQGKDKAAVFWHLGRWQALADPAGPEEKTEFVEPAPAVVRGDALLWDDDLLAAIHCKALGWHALAKTLFESRRVIIPETADADLASTAWLHWKSKIQDPDVSWPETARHLRSILNDRPKDFRSYDKDFLRSLELALVPSKATPGSLASLVDDLIEVRTGPFGDLTKESAARYQKLALRGFEAVPTLIEHLDDERLTKRYRPGFNNFRGFHYRICDFATDLLQELAGDDLGAWRLRGDILGKATAQAWWEEAKMVGEEGYFAGRVLGKKEAHRPNDLMLEIIAQKYPKNLPQVYRQMLADRPKMDGSPILEAIANSSLPIEEKRTLLQLGAKHENPRHRDEALKLLKNLDQK